MTPLASNGAGRSRPAVDLPTSRRTVVLIAGVLIATAIYIAGYTLVFCVAAIAYQRGIVIDRPGILDIQRELYLNGGWNVWQTRRDCVVFDEQLLYKPKIGACRFDNVEFKTVLHFTPDGRRMRDKTSAGKAIALIGDSFAMGWGVNDAETFAAELQRRSGRKVYNLAVSSYGTVREVIRLSQFAHLDDVDTVIIQYCENDLAENVGSKPRSPADALRKFVGITEGRRSDRWSVVRYYWRCYRAMLRRPIDALWRRMRGDTEPEDFRDHYPALMKVIRNAPWLRGKKIIIFYTRGYGVQFKNFPTGRDPELENVTFVDVHVDPRDFYKLDPHLTTGGNKSVGRQLAAVLAHDS